MRWRPPRLKPPDVGDAWAVGHHSGRSVVSMELCMLVPMNESCLLLLMLIFQGMQLRHLGQLL